MGWFEYFLTADLLGFLLHRYSGGGGDHPVSGDAADGK